MKNWGKTRKEIRDERLDEIVKESVEEVVRRAKKIIAAGRPLCSHPDLKTQPPRHDQTTPYYPKLGPDC